ncbi:MAG: alpha/beta hydrolase family protein [Candidatus Helarchaeota archaeon]
MTFLDSVKSLLKMVFNRRIGFIVCALFCVIGPLLAATGTFNEVRSDRISFRTNPKYTYEINTFFSTQTYGNLVQDYEVSGYLFTPPIYFNFLSPNGKLPAIIWMHGMTASAEIQYNIPRALASAGFKVLSISHPGHGDSGGLWDMGIQTLVGVYSAVDYLTYMCWDVDSSKIGVSGHSMGGITTTRAGIFDNWTNPVTGNKIGTGKISACGAIYAWDDMLNTIIDTFSRIHSGISPLLAYLPNDLKYTYIFSEPSINWLFSTWTWLGNGIPATVPFQMEARSTANYINSTNIKNYMLITGWEDQLTNPLFQANIMQNSTKNATGTPQVDSGEILRSVIGNLVWNYGNITEGTARRFVVVPGTEHIKEAVGDEVTYNLIIWFNQALGVTWNGSPALALLSPNFVSDFIIRNLGWIILLIGSLGLIPIGVSYLNTWFPRKNGLNQETRSYEKKEMFRKILMYAGIFIGFGVLGNALFRFAFPVQSFTRFWFWDFVGLFTLFSALFQLPAILAILLYEWKKEGLSFKRLGLSPHSALRGIAIGILAFLPAILVYNPLAYSTNLPLFLPRPLEAGVYTDFFILMGLMFLQAIVYELLFRGLIQTKLDTGQKRSERWNTLLFSGLICGIFVGITFAISMSIAFYSMITPLLFFLIFGVFFLIFFSASILNGFIYQRTKSIITSIIIIALLLTFFEAGKLLLIYA